MSEIAKVKLREVFDGYVEQGILRKDDVQLNDADVKLVGDHQMGTCRMGEDPAESVLDPFCRLHDADNVFVVDTSFMPTGFGLNPMVTVVANTLRVGSWMVDELRPGGRLAG